MKISKVNGVVWFTNLKKPTNKKKLILTKKYNPSEYPKYENYNAINVNKVKDIPKDYLGYIGVPVTYLGQHCPDQFEIVGCADADITPNGWSGMSSNFVDLYYKQGNTGSYKEGNRLASYIDSKGNAKVPFKRIIIKQKQNKNEN